MNRISMFKNFTKVIGHRSLEAIIEAIRKDTYKEQILKIRTTILEEDYKLKDQLKKQLNAFTVSGEFEGGRTMDKLVNYHPFVILDIDKISLETLERIQKQVLEIPYTRAGFISPSGRGYKIIIQINSTIETHTSLFVQVADYYEAELKVKIDRSGKDITRLCFMSWDEKAYWNPESKVFQTRYSQKEFVSISNNGNLKTINTHFENKMSSHSTAITDCLAYTQQKENYENGNRNNFIYLFASNCNRKGVPIQETLSFSKEKFELGNIELEKTITSAYKHHTFEMPNKSRTKEEEKIGEILGKSECLPDVIFDSLPKLLKQSCSVFSDQRERDVFLTGALAILSGCLPKVEGLYDRGINYPNLFSFIIAPAASGKGVLKYAKMLGDAYHNHLKELSLDHLQEYKIAFAAYQQTMLDYKRRKLATPPEEPEKPPFKILYIPANSSSAMVIKSLKESNERGIICETEADTLGNTLKQDWGGYSDLLRKAFHFEKVSYSRKTNDEFLEIDEPQLSVVLSGTPNQILKLIPSTEDGLFSRFLFYAFSVKSNWRDVSPNCRQLNLNQHFKKLSEEVLEMAMFLENHPTKINLTTEQWEILNNNFTNMLRESNAFVEAEADSTIKRLGVILYRIAMIFTALRKYETKSIVTESVCQDRDFISALKLVEIYRKHAILLLERLPKNKLIQFQRLSNHKRIFFKALPNKFQRKEAVTIGLQIGLAERSIDRYLKKLLSLNFLQQKEYGWYQKN